MKCFKCFLVPLVFILLSVQFSTPLHAQTTTDWPMFGHDPQHSGTTTAQFTPTLSSSGCVLQSSLEVSPCMQFKFKRKLGEWAHGFSQPVVVGGTLFQAAMDGKLIALDAQSGAEKFVFTASGAIATTPAVVGSTLFVGDFAGKIYGISTSNGGHVFTPIQTGGPIYSSPVAFQEDGIVKVFVGSNDGKLYGFNGSNGQLLFPPFDTNGSAIMSNPAWYQGTVFFAAEDMNAYALDSKTGQLRWWHTLDGESNRGNHPVVIPASNSVLFFSVPRFGGTGMGLKDRFFVYELSGHGGRTARPLSNILFDYQSQVASHPKTKSMHLFSISSGAEVTGFSAGQQSLQMIPLNNWYSNGQHLPLVMNQKDLLFSAFGGYVSLDTTSKTFSVAYPEQPVRGDEYTAVTVADGWLYGGFTSNIARVRLSDHRREQLRGCKDCGDNYPLFDSFSGPHWEGYTGDGYTDIGGYFIVANGRGYISINGWLYGF